MGNASESLEHAEHIAHAHGDKLTKWVGITMAMLGVVLAYSAAKVGGQRTELVQALVDQQHAHAKYTAQDIKHRVAVLTLQQLHAEAEVGRTSGKDMVLIANTIDRYLAESNAADAWVDAYDPLIEAHALGQEHYERAQLAAEIGIVIASIALLLRRREAWWVSIALGGLAIGLVLHTYLASHSTIHDAEANIEKTESAYEGLRKVNKTTDLDQALVDEVKRTYGAAATPR
jgi:fructose/tagatose bisphosphate aldolase